MQDARKKSAPVARHIHNRKRAEGAPEGFVTRRGLREKVGITESQLRSLLARDVIAADGTNAGGYAIYSVKTVERLLNKKADGSLFRNLSADPSVLSAGNTSTYSAEEGVRVFELLHEGRSVEEIILETKIHPLVVKAIRADYDEIVGSIHLPKRVVDKINAIEILPGSFPLRDADGVLDVLEQYALNRACSNCKTQEALNLCQYCLMRARRLARQREHDATVVSVDAPLSQNAELGAGRR